MIKKIIAIILTLLLLVCLCGCGSDNENTDGSSFIDAESIIVEEIGDKIVTYIKHPSTEIILSKTEYNTKTGITSEHVYIYENRGWGMTQVGSNIVIYDAEGNIIDTRED